MIFQTSWVQSVDTRICVLHQHVELSGELEHLNGHKRYDISYRLKPIQDLIQQLMRLNSRFPYVDVPTIVHSQILTGP